MKYIGLTIGPIYKTLQNSKKPKELWSSSYIFSYIMKNIISDFKSRNFITPYIQDDSIFDDKGEVGLFHDNFIFESNDRDIELLQNTIDKVITNLAKKLNLDKNILEDYLQINYGEYEVADNENPILKISPYLDTQELFFELSQDADSSFQNRLKEKDNFLLKDKNIIDDLEKLTSKKYYAVIHADGDNMSKAIADKTKIEKISKNLFEYCKISNKLIKMFGGQTIFAGGDDLLFFAPVFNAEKTKTIFNLCDEISKDFQTRFENVATLSFGITINYIKFPLYEALENSREQLFAKAKSGQKNNIAFKLTKHSGQSFETIIHKGSKEIYENFLLFSSNINNGEGMDNFLHSLHHKIDTHSVTINQIASSKVRLENFFQNYFNKDEHKQYEEFFKQLIEFIYEVFQDTTIKQDEKLNIIYSTLRFIKFVQGDKK